MREKVCDVQFRTFLAASNNRFKTAAQANTYSQQFNPVRSVQTNTYVCTVSPGTTYTYYEVLDNACDLQFAAFINSVPNRFGTTVEADAYNQQFNPRRFIDTKIFLCTVAPNTPYRYFEVVQPNSCQGLYDQTLNNYNASNRRMLYSQYLKRAFVNPAQATSYVDSLPAYADVNRDFQFNPNRVLQPREFLQIVYAYAQYNDCPEFEYFIVTELDDINEITEVPFEP